MKSPPGQSSLGGAAACQAEGCFAPGIVPPQQLCAPPRNTTFKTRQSPNSLNFDNVLASFCLIPVTLLTTVPLKVSSPAEAPAEAPEETEVPAHTLNPLPAHAFSYLGLVIRAVVLFILRNNSVFQCNVVLLVLLPVSTRVLQV